MKRSSSRPLSFVSPWLLAAGLAAVVFAVYGRAVTFDFVNWDDLQQVIENPNVNPPSLRGVAESWQDPYWRLYIPVSYTFFSAEAAIAQDVDPESGVRHLRPAVFHLGNLLLHAGCTLLVFAILRRLLKSTEPVAAPRVVSDSPTEETKINFRRNVAAALGALLFAVHPLQIESVAWISEARGLLCALFGLLALWQYILFADTSPRREARWTWYGGASLAMLLALLSKPAAVALPFMAAALGVGLLRRRPVKVFRETLPWLVAAAVFAVATKLLQPDSQLNSTIRLAARPLIALDTISFYVGKLFLPLPLSADYGRTPSFVLHGSSFQIGWIILPLALAALAWFRPRRIPLTSFLLFLFWLAPVLGLVAFDFQRVSTVADRYVCLGMLGPALLTAWLIDRFWDRGIALAAGGACAILAAITFAQLGAWRSTGDLFVHAFAVNPRSAVAAYHLGRLEMLAGHSANAVQWLDKSLKYGPGNIETHLELAKTLYLAGQPEAARDVLWKAPAVTDSEKRAVENALKEFSSRHSSFVEVAAEINTGRAEELAGHLVEARKHYLAALAIQPRNFKALYNLGNLAFAEGNWQEAIDHYREALKIDAEYAEAYTNLAAALIRTGQLDEAAEMAHAATIAEPNLLSAHMIYGQALLLNGRKPAAAAEFRRALQLADSPQRPMIQKMLDAAEH